MSFQFAYMCPNCRQQIQSPPIESQSYKKGQMLSGLGSLIGAAASMMGKYNIGYGLQQGMSVLNQFENMTPAWKKEHDAALETAKKYFIEHCDQCEKKAPQQQQQQTTQGKFCTNCGSPISPEAKFCAKCGNKL